MARYKTGMSSKIKNPPSGRAINLGRPINGWLGELQSGFLKNGHNPLVFDDNARAPEWVESVSIVENSDGFRCDNFTKHPSGKHLLFAGCSVTFGSGLEKEESWPWLVYEEISKNEKVSGYFNIARPGISISVIVSWIFKYINTYGNPDAIFINLPNLARFSTIYTNPVTNRNVLVGSMISPNDIVDQISLDYIKYTTFELYNMLDIYCRNMGIRLVSFSWSEGNPMGDPKEIFGNLDSFYSLREKYNLEKYIYSYIESHKNDKNADFLLCARDNHHPGIAEQHYYADVALNIYDGSEMRWVHENLGNQ